MSERRRHWEATAVWSDFCAVSPSPELRARIMQEAADAGIVETRLAGLRALGKAPRWPGFDDGMVFPPTEFPPGTPSSRVRNAARDRAPLRGTLKIAVIMVDFPDKPTATDPAVIKDLFFSLGQLPHGSLREYFRDVSNNLVDVVGEVVPTVRLPKSLAFYANDNFGIGRPTGIRRAPIMASDAVIAANPLLNFAPFDNDGDGFVEALIIVHAGQGGEVTGFPGDIWSHKGILPTQRVVDGVKVFPYLAVPEAAKLGVCAHEIGHLLFGLPDLYDSDFSSMGVGDWCLMGTGSWGAGGEIPVHPSAWCKLNQGWANVNVVTAPGELSLPDVKTSRVVHRLWTNGSPGQEYFLAENRQRAGYDKSLPGEGLLLWHIDESRPDNNDENHLKVGVVQADGKRDIELNVNAGDLGDPYPGASGNSTFGSTSVPKSASYAGTDTCVTVSEISASGPVMTAKVTVVCPKPKDTKEKEGKEHKDKEGKDGKEVSKDIKDHQIEKTSKDFKDKDGKDISKENKDHHKELESPPKPVEAPGVTHASLLELQARLSAVEQALAGPGQEYVEPFIGPALRPDLAGGPAPDEAAALRQAAEAGDPQAKRAFDSRPPG
ncbi:M6 family metalloprotease domain-containing protein [Streptomyces sp. NPDC001657]|uniref:M6 family metalloprotease domain-containing protein n=1 Tax=Streptomyces sp. NPDC001657 TaxID=3154522 RepID=UPI003318A72B